MKTKIIFIFCSLFCFGKAFPNYPFHIKGSGFQAFNNKLIYLTFTEIKDGAYKKQTDSTFVRNGYFAFEGFLNNPGCDAELSIKKMKQFYFFILDSGQLQVQPKTNIKLAELVIPSSETNRLKNSISRMQSQLILNGKPIQGKSYRDIVLIELAMIEKEPENFYSLITLTKIKNLNRIISTEELAKSYYLLNDKLRNSALGKYLEQRINQAMALHPGKPFPDFKFMDLNGRMQNRDTLKGKINLIAFGATWCGPCQKGIPELISLHENIDSNKFQIVYINMDNNNENWLRMIEKQGMQGLLNLSDTVPSTSLSLMKEIFSINGIPFYLIIDQHNIISYNSYLVKDEDHKLRNKVIEKLLKSMQIPFNNFTISL